MKKYNKEVLLKSSPKGSTHLHHNEFRFDYIQHGKDCYRVWLGSKHGGWSFMINYKHPNYNELTILIKSVEE